MHPHFPAAHAPHTLRPDPQALMLAIQTIFDRWDVDRSGQLSLEEFRNGLTNEARAPEYRDDPSIRLISRAVAATGGAERMF